MTVSLGLASPAVAATPDPPTSPGLTNSAQLTSPVVVDGIVLDNEGRAAAGTPVVIMVWPDSESLGRLPIGAAVPTENVAIATTDALGKFVLRLDGSKSLTQFANTNGIVNFDVVAGTGSARAAFSMSQSLVQLSASEIAKSVSGAPAEAAHVTMALGPDAATSATRSAAVVPTIGCSLQKIGTYGLQWVSVGETYTHAYSTAKFTFNASSGSSLGVAVSSGGAFTASGTSSTSSSTTITFPTAAVSTSRIWRSQYVYDKYTDLCGHTYARPGAFGGSQGYLITGAPTSTYCVVTLGGSTFERASSTASTFAGGVGIAAAIGINLSAQTGFSTSAKVAYTFSASGHICGTNGLPGSSPGRLVAKG